MSPPHPSSPFNDTPPRRPSAVERYAKAFTAPHVALRDAPRPHTLYSELWQCRNATGWAWPGDQELRRRLKCSQRTLERTRAELLRRVPAWVHVHRIHLGNGRLGANRYFLPDTPEPNIFQPPKHQPPPVAVLFDEQDPKKEQEQERANGAARSQASTNEDGATAAGTNGRADASRGSPTPERSEERTGTRRETPGPSGRSVLSALVQRTRLAEHITDPGELLTRIAPDVTRLQRDGVDVSGVAAEVDRVFRWAVVQTRLPFPPTLVRRHTVLGAFRAYVRQHIIAPRGHGEGFLCMLFDDRTIDRGGAIVVNVSPLLVRTGDFDRLRERDGPALDAAATHVGRRLEWVLSEPSTYDPRAPGNSSRVAWSGTPIASGPGRGPFKAKTRAPDVGRLFLEHLQQHIDRRAFFAWFGPLFDLGGITDRGDVLVLAVTQHARGRILEHYAPELAAAAAHVRRVVEWRLDDARTVTDGSPYRSVMESPIEPPTGSMKEGIDR